MEMTRINKKILQNYYEICPHNITPTRLLKPQDDLNESLFSQRFEKLGHAWVFMGSEWPVQYADNPS